MRMDMVYTKNKLAMIVLRMMKEVNFFYYKTDATRNTDGFGMLLFFLISRRKKFKQNCFTAVISHSIFDLSTKV